MSTGIKDLGIRPQSSGIGWPRLPARELLGTALQGLHTRRLRAAPSALGIAIGIGAMVAVVGVPASSDANLLAEINALGTNLLTVAPDGASRSAGGAARHCRADNRPHAERAERRRCLPGRLMERTSGEHKIRRPAQWCSRHERKPRHARRQAQAGRSPRA